MATKRPLSVKHGQITKSQGAILVSTALAAFLLVFACVASKTLVDQISYNNRVIEAKRKAVSQLKANTQTASQLVTSYKAFIGTTTNVIGGVPDGSGERDGDNSKIILDALPSKYDFPAVATSLEQIMLKQSLQIASISGSDDEVAQAVNASSPVPQPIEVPFEVSAVGPYANIRDSLSVFDKSIRPFSVKTLQLSGNQNSMTASITGNSYYQPAKNFNVAQKVVK